MNETDTPATSGRIERLKEAAKRVGEPSNVPESITTQYIRMMLIVLVVVLLVATAWVSCTESYLETSISDYYHTAARPILVAVMFGVGLCMMALYSKNPWENLLLNVSGAFAPIVGLAATTQEMKKPLEFDVPTPEVNRLAEIALPAYFAGLFLLGCLVFVVHPKGVMVPRNTTRWWHLSWWKETAKSVKGKGWMTLAAIGILAGATWCAWNTDALQRKVHTAAAGSFFVPLIILVLLKGFNARRKKPGKQSRVYLGIGFTMTGAVLAFVIDRLVTKCKYSVLIIEFTLISLFALYWVIEFYRGRKTPTAPV
ncbi:MAG: hypothetical protein ABL953_07640 [Ilumatobacteraceae bacterium]